MNNGRHTTMAEQTNQEDQDIRKLCAELLAVASEPGKVRLGVAVKLWDALAIAITGRPNLKLPSEQDLRALSEQLATAARYMGDAADTIAKLQGEAPSAEGAQS